MTAAGATPVLDRFGGRSAQDGPVKGPTRRVISGATAGSPVIQAHVPIAAPRAAIVRVKP